MHMYCTKTIDISDMTLDDCTARGYTEAAQICLQ